MTTENLRTGDRGAGDRSTPTSAGQLCGDMTCLPRFMASVESFRKANVKRKRIIYRRSCMYKSLPVAKSIRGAQWKRIKQQRKKVEMPTQM